MKWDISSQQNENQMAMGNNMEAISSQTLH